MKKKIEIEIPDSLPNMDGADQRKEASERKLMMLVNAIAKRTKKNPVAQAAIAKKGKKVSVEMDLTAKQVSGLPVGLRKVVR